MRAKIFVVLESVFLGLGMLVLTPSANPTAVGKAGSPSQTHQPPLTTTPQANFEERQQKPLAIWECTTSWYGEDFDGQQTANGETYDMYAETAAHPTLPLGSIVRVVNTKNHRSQVVRINDRGPYVEGRELDVSYAVAKQLGFDQRGTAKVRLELLEVPSRPALGTSQLIVALDVDRLGPACALARQLRGAAGLFKVGIQLFTAEGPQAVEKLAGLGFDIFLDLKFHDIPNTVAGAVAAAAELPKVRLINVHTLGGRRDDARGARGLERDARSARRCLGVTILTSMDARGAAPGGDFGNAMLASGGAGAACEASRARWSGRVGA